MLGTSSDFSLANVYVAIFSIVPKDSEETELGQQNRNGEVFQSSCLFHPEDGVHPTSPTS